MHSSWTQPTPPSQGEQRYGDGSTYVGYWREDLRDGEGKGFSLVCSASGQMCVFVHCCTRGSDSCQDSCVYVYTPAAREGELCGIGTFSSCVPSPSLHDG
jgi:hypothetical protein